MIKLNVIGQKQFQQAINKLPTTLKKEVGTRLKAGADQWRSQAIKDAPADVGFLRSQITVKTIDELKYEVVSGASYSAYMEFGTKSKFKPIPGIDASEFKGKGRGDYYDFLNNILDWVKRKGLHNVKNSYTGKNVGGKAAKENLLVLAEAIAWSILRKGVNPHPFFFKQFPIVRRDLFRNLRRTINELT